uniref:C2 calcium lipid binding region CaLB n=1 Tax=Echinococcus granulosus TaxID=6210 RepID=A0A068WCL7_ECHGR|nr:C2 calcium lipid binding region CaLB [Echinococcus granulosus]
MESLLARLVTYKFMDGPGLVNDLFNQPKEKLLFSLLLFMLIIGSSLCIVYRTLFQRGSSVSKSSTHKNIDPQLLVNLWTDQNRNLCTGIVDLCVVPNGVKNVLYLPRVSSPVIYSQRSPPTVSANIMSLPLLVTSNRLSFSGECQGNQKVSHIRFSLSNFSLEVMLNLSFNNTNLIALQGVSSHPHFSLSIESPDPLENAKQDLLCTIEDIVSNLHLIWKDAGALLDSQEILKSSKGCNELFSDLDSKVTEDEGEDLYPSTFSQSFHFESGIASKGNTKTAIELNANILTESVHSLPEAASINPVFLDSHLHMANIFAPSSETDDSTEALPEPMVLAYNPSLKKKLGESIYRRHQRSASDFVDQEVEDTEGTLNDTEPVPLDPIVHPPEEQHPTDQNEGKPVFSLPNQRSLKRVIDVSPLHERVTPNLASKNLLVKVVKADFIDLKSSSDAYCVVELDEPYQRHATHVVPPSEQLFWDQHLLFGLNSNSKRATFEVFELSKRRKSISRGYAEVYLPELLTSSVRGCLSELLRCIPLDPKQHSSSTLGMAVGIGGSGGGKWDHTSNPTSSSTSLTIRKPTVTAEFHFMERLIDDPFSVCKGRSGVSSPTPLSKLRAAAMTSPASSSDSSLSQTAGAAASDSTGTGIGAGADRSLHSSKEEMEDNKQLELETPKDVTPTPLMESGKQHESRLQRSTSTRGSRLFEPAFENLRLADTNAALTSRQQYGHRAGGGYGGLRRKSVPRVLSTGLGGGSSSTTSGFGLLGPSSQLAAVVAGLTAASVESSDASVDPSTAAAVASAVAVAAATGRSTSSSAALDRRVMAIGAGSGGVVGPADSLFEGTATSMATLGISEHEPRSDTVVRYAAPAANVAESLGTYSAQLPPKRSDATGAKLINLFKSKKKHQQPSGMARLLYLQDLEGSEFDAISTEGYQRILHGDQTEKQ